MDTPENNASYLKCPYCACIFFTQLDLDAHIKQFGTNPTQHAKDYKDVNAKIEFGYGSDE
jgi:uncharacterized C2H2 Zn-finger protein